MLLDFGPWRPDLTALDSGCAEAVNVVPGVGSYNPQPSLVTYTDALDSRCCGAISVMDIAAGVYWFAGDSNHLYTINVTTASWSNVSKLSSSALEVTGIECGTGFGIVTIVTPHGHAGPVGFGSAGIDAINITSVGGIAVPASFGGITIICPSGIGCGVGFGAPNISGASYAYSTSASANWSFAQYGNNLYASNYNNPIQVYSLGSGSRFNDLGGGPPNARYINIVKNFMVAVNTKTIIDGVTPQRVRWSGLDAPNTWTVDITTQADFQDLLGDGGVNQGILVGLTQSDAVIFQERAVWRMTYEGLPSVFIFDLVEGVRGTPAPNSLVAVGGIAYYLGEDGFYAFDGAQSTSIGNGRIDRTFRADVNTAYLRRITAVADVGRKFIFWGYPSTASASGNPDKILVYNYSTGEWSLIEEEVEILWQTLTPGYTLEDLDIFGDLDSLLVGLDSRQWSGGNRQLSAFNPLHQTAHFSGANKAAHLTTREITTPSPQRLLVREAWPLVDCRNTTTELKIAVGSRKHANDTVSFAPATSMNTVGFCPQRVGDHYVRLRLSLTSSLVWDNAYGIDVQFGKTGTR